MQTYYSVTNFFNNVCTAHPNIKSFTLGDLYTVDMKKQQLFPLAHLIVNNVNIDTGLMTYNVTLMVMDRVADIVDLSEGHYNNLVKNSYQRLNSRFSFQMLESLLAEIFKK